MDDSTVLPIFTKIVHQPNPGAANEFSVEVEKLVAGGRRQIGEFGDFARKTLDTALSVSRNQTGSLDLNVPQLKEAAAAQQQRALAARELANATLAAAKVQGTYNQETREAISALKAQAHAEEQAAAAAMSHARAAELVQAELNKQMSAMERVFRSTVSGSAANKLLANSQGAVRTASIQAGQQLQDLGISIYSGQRASIVFAQQLPQLAFALSNLEGNANKTLDKIGKFGTFLSGPMGLLVSLGVGVLGSYIASLVSAGDKSDQTGSATSRLVDKLDIAKNSYSSLMAVVDEYNKSQDKSTALTYDAIIAAEKLAQKNLDVAKSQLAVLRANQASPDFSGEAAADFAKSQGIEALQSIVDQLKKDLAKAGVGAGAERVKRETDKRYDIEVGYDTQIVQLEERRKRNLIDQVAYEKKRLELISAQKAALKAYDDANKGSVNKAAQLASFPLPFSAASITSGFGKRTAPTKGASTYHQGIDFAVPLGTAVKVQQVGVVEAVGYSPSLGKYVVINHGGGTQTRYGHLSDNSIVREGEAVGKGDVIGKSGSTGTSTGPHLHYEVLVNGKRVDPTKGLFPLDDVKTSEAAEKALAKAKAAAEQLQNFGESAADSISKINDRFNESPRLIDQAVQATRSLEQTIKDLGEKKPLGFAEMIQQAEAAKRTIQDALVRPVTQMREESERQLQVQELLIAGRDEEAAAAQAVWALEDKLGKEEVLRAQMQGYIAAGKTQEAEALNRLLAVYPDLKRQTAEIAANEVATNKELAIRQGIIANYLQATHSIRSELEAVFSGDGSIKNIGKALKDLNGKVAVENLFGPAFRELDEWTKSQGGAEQSVDFLTKQSHRAGDALASVADVAATVSQRLTNPSSVVGGTPLGDDAPLTFAEAFDPYYLAGLKGETLPIEVNGNRGANDNGLPANSVWKLDAQQFYRGIARALTAPFQDALQSIGGPKFAQQLNGVVGGALYGYSVGGLPGGILGALKDATNPAEGEAASWLNDKLGKALGGSQTGSQVAGLAKAVGFEKFSTTGAQIGGSIGAMTQIPGADIIGSIIGGTIGALFKKAKQTYATFGNLAPGEYDLGGGDKYTDQANDLAKAVLDGLGKLTDAFGGALSDFNLKIGVRNGEYYVDPTGQDSFKNGKNFGDDQAAAIAYAIQDAIKDGAVKGLSASIQTLLTKEGSDLETQLQKALDMQGVFDQLKAIKDPVGAAIDDLDKQFDKLKDIFTEAGASTEEYAQLEELYQLERTKAIKEAVDQMTASLQSLYDDLTVNNSALSLRERQADAQATYDSLAARIKAGDTTAYDDYAAAAKTLLDIDRQLYGSQDEYFQQQAEITALTKATLDKINVQADAAASAADPFSGSTVPTTDNAGVVSAIESGNAIAAAMNANLTNRLDLIATLIANSNEKTSAAAAKVSNF